MAKLLGARGIRSAFETIGIIIVLFTLSWPLAVVLLVSALLLTPLITRLSASIGAASKASQAAAANVSAAADEIVENMRVVKLFAQQQRELRRFDTLLNGAHQLALKVGGRAGGDGWLAALQVGGASLARLLPPDPCNLLPTSSPAACCRRCCACRRCCMGQAACATRCACWPRWAWVPTWLSTRPSPWAPATASLSSGA